MDLIRVFHRFPDHESCLEHLEQVRWGDRPSLPTLWFRERSAQG